MRRFFGIIFAIIIALVIAAVAVYLLKRQILANILSRELGVRVHIESLTKSGDLISIGGISVGNVKNGELPLSLQVKMITLKAPFGNYFKKRVVIDNISMSDVTLNLEFLNSSQTESNWITILNSITEGEKPPKREGKGRSAVIKKLTVNPLNVNVLVLGQEVKSFAPINNLTFTDLDTQNGDLSRRITYQIASRLLKRAFVDEALKQIIESPEKSFEGLQKALDL